jgi:hypothetical protein
MVNKSASAAVCIYCAFTIISLYNKMVRKRLLFHFVIQLLFLSPLAGVVSYREARIQSMHCMLCHLTEILDSCH